MSWYPHANKLIHDIEKCPGTLMLTNCSKKCAIPAMQ